MSQDSIADSRFGAYVNPDEARALREQLDSAEQEAIRLRYELANLELKPSCGLPLCSPGDCEHV